MCEILREHAVNTDYRKRDKNIKVPAAIFLLDQKMNALEFFERIKVIALYYKRWKKKLF